MRHSYWPIIIMAFVWSGCDSGDEPRDVAAPVLRVGADAGPCPSGPQEEEVFGNIYGTSVTGGAILSPRDQVSEDNQAENWVRSVTVADCVHQNKGAHFGWFGMPPWYGGCEVNANNSLHSAIERHSPFGHPFEQHCIRSGRFTLLFELVGGLESRELEIDYVEYPYTADGFRIESPNSVGTTNLTSDVIVHFDAVSNGRNATPVIEVDVQTTVNAPSWNGNPVSAGQTVTGLTSQWFRFGAWNSATTWEPGGRGELLVRYFWDYDGDRANRTGFINATAGETDNARVHQFPPGLHSVVAHLAEPDEFGDVDKADWGSSLSFYVKACNPSLVAAQQTPAPPSPPVGQTVHFEAITGQGQDGCGDLQFRWRIGSTEVQGWSAAGSVFETAFTSAGQKTVTLEVRDRDGRTDADAVTITVIDPQPLSVSIVPFYPNPNGPVQPNQLCEWRANVQGGTASIVWHKSFKRGWQQVGTGRFLDMNTGGLSFNLRVTATAGGVQASATLPVTVSSKLGQYCP